MPAIKHIVWRLGASWEATDAAELSQRTEPRKATSQQLMWVRLVSGVKDDAIHRRVHHPVKGDRQLHNAEARSEMPTGNGGRGDDGGAKLLCDLVKLCA
jgi:hypothetical protein